MRFSTAEHFSKNGFISASVDGLTQKKVLRSCPKINFEKLKGLGTLHEEDQG